MNGFEQLIPPAERLAEVGLDPARLARVDRLLTTATAAREVPGAVAAVARRGRRVFYGAYGHAALSPEPRLMRPDTLFDIASLTKVVATLPSVLLLLEEGRFRLDDPVVKFIPEFGTNNKEHITLRQLLSHTSGLVWWRDFHNHCHSQAEFIAAICNEELNYPTGSKVVYSDLNFILLGEIVRRLTGQRIDAFAGARVFAPLSMNDTGFNPAQERAGNCAATEYRAGLGRCQCCEVHDENATACGGVSGHAGLFSTAADLLLYGQMWLNGGQLGGRRLLSQATVRAATTEQTAGLDDRRAIGWLLKTRDYASSGDLFTWKAYGHTGFTGTSLWVDPELELVAVLLTNRVHPTRDNPAFLSVRARFHNLVAAAIED